MYENHCCGGGHCGPLPGYDFNCPQCHKEAYAPTGEPLKPKDLFSCSQCQSEFEVIGELSDNYFEVSLSDLN